MWPGLGKHQGNLRRLINISGAQYGECFAASFIHHNLLPKTFNIFAKRILNIPILTKGLMEKGMLRLRC